MYVFGLAAASEVELETFHSGRTLDGRAAAMLGIGSPGHASSPKGSSATKRSTMVMDV